MSRPPAISTANDTVAPNRGVRTPNGLFISRARLNHLMPHQFMLQSRVGVQPHGIWEADAADRMYYGNLMMKILACSDRAWKRVQRGSARVISQGNRGLNTRYDVRVSTTHNAGRTVRPNGRGGQITRWTQNVRLVVRPAVMAQSGNMVRPVITSFPV